MVFEGQMITTAERVRLIVSNNTKLIKASTASHDEVMLQAAAFVRQTNAVTIKKHKDFTLNLEFLLLLLVTNSPSPLESS